MSDWKYEINDGLVAFYENGIERNIDKVFDTLNAAEARIAELSQAVGLITTLKPTMVMDVDHPLDMAKEVEAYVTARIAELEAAQRWIPVSERLPLLRDSKAVLVYTKSGETYSGLYLGNNEWTGLLHDFREGEVTHWMPLPEPPIVYGKEREK